MSARSLLCYLKEILVIDYYLKWGRELDVYLEMSENLPSEARLLPERIAKICGGIDQASDVLLKGKKMGISFPTAATLSRIALLRREVADLERTDILQFITIGSSAFTGLNRDRENPNIFAFHEALTINAGKDICSRNWETLDNCQLLLWKAEQQDFLAELEQSQFDGEQTCAIFAFDLARRINLPDLGKWLGVFADLAVEGSHLFLEIPEGEHNKLYDPIRNSPWRCEHTIKAAEQKALWYPALEIPDSGFMILELGLRKDN